MGCVTRNLSQQSLVHNETTKKINANNPKEVMVLNLYAVVQRDLRHKITTEVYD